MHRNNGGATALAYLLQSKEQGEEAATRFLYPRYCVYRVRQSRQLPLGLGLGAPSLYAAVLARVSAAFNGPLARAVVFGVHIDGSPSFFVCSQDGSAVLVSHTQWPRDFSGHLIVEGLLIAVIVFQLSTKSYKPLKKPLTEKEIDELCDEWEPELLCPPIKEGAKIDAPTLERNKVVMEGFMTAIIQFLEALESFYVVERDGSIILFLVTLGGCHSSDYIKKMTLSLGLRDMAFHSAQLDLSPEHRRKVSICTVDPKPHFVLVCVQFKLCKVRSVQFGQKVIPYLNTYDDRTIRYPDPLIKANDTIKIDLETNKIMDFIKLTSSSYILS
ncbi:hypothetical protein ZEAMMB73_Zm00001d049112 [Zea mays]|uniref:Small ribosomal subunit protein eS4 central region domain-containing protein n=1 Tax=Zea mays TaxID=4577 RepID=A0A1D6PSE1_MAIZE|nr:hypothetical protein ZEAMMB73_Zm00001d049112 [Zea mays]